jgi:hypothetical protein
MLADRSAIQPQTVAFTSIVCTQLAQTLDLGRLDGRVSGSVAGAVAGTAAIMALSVMLPPVRGFSALTTPSVRAIALIGAASAAAAASGRTLGHRPIRRLAMSTRPSKPAT